MKLILLTTLQSVLTVGGLGLLGMAMGGREFSVRMFFDGLFSIHGVGGVVCLVASFIVTSVVLSFARLSIFIPLNTGLVFLFTVLFTLLFHDEGVSLPVILGMSLIIAGIAIVSVYRPA
jgi:multidrug transporter EmrE-like cation transporter